MRKKLVLALCIILLSLPFSCSELILPKNIDIHGTLDLSIKVVSDNWGNAVASVLKKAFIGNYEKIDKVDFDAEVYDVNYGQAEQIFLISMYSEMTNHLNPAEYLKEAGEFLYQKNTTEKFDISYEIDISDLKEKELSFQEQTITIPGFIIGSSSYLIPLPVMDLELEIDGFLHASIAEGNMEIMIELVNEGTILDNSALDITYNINIIQDDINPYTGLSCSIGPSNNVPLDEEHINNEKVKISGSSVLITTKSGTPIGLSSGELKVNITVKISTQKLNELHWDFLDIADQLNEHQLEPVSLDNVSPYVNYVLYEEESIGLHFEFEEMIDGLEMSIESNALGIAGSQFKELKKGKKITFSNENAGTLWLAEANPLIPGYPSFDGKVAEAFDFELALQPKGGGNILHIHPAEGITPDVLKIKGKAEFFQNWTEAQINMVNAIKAAPNAVGAYSKRIPAEGKDPIDSSILTDYITGFTFENIQSEMHINGPDGVVNSSHVLENPTLSLWAEFWGDSLLEKQKEPIYNDGSLILEEHPVSLADSDFDANGSYNKSTLPPNGKRFNFTKIMDAQPKNLIFNYEIKIPDTLTVTHDLFEAENTIIDSKITLTILIMLPLKLTVVEDGPGIIKFPDMFGEMEDLFGRTDIEEDSIFNSLNIEYINFSVDFTGSFFSGGKLFLEKEGQEQLFPNGIDLNGSKIVLNISGADFETIKNNLISPDFRLIFGSPDSMINVPRNIGFTNIKFEARGKFEL
jgi:hypothetical protein